MSIGTATAANGTNAQLTSSPAWTGLTHAAWFQYQGSTGSFPTFISVQNSGGGSYDWIGLDTAAGQIKGYGGSGVAFTGSLGATPSVGDWIYCAITHDATTITYYVKVNGGASVTTTLSMC